MVLIVDDDSAIADTLGLVMDGMGVEHDKAECIESAKAKLNHRRVSILLVDVVLAGEDGCDLVKECQTHWPDLPIIMMSAMCPTKLECIARELRIDHYLSKPFSIERLEQIIRDCQKKSVNILTAG